MFLICFIEIIKTLYITYGVKIGHKINVQNKNTQRRIEFDISISFQ